MKADLARMYAAIKREQSQPVETRHFVAIAAAKERRLIARTEAVIAAGRRAIEGVAA